MTTLINSLRSIFSRSPPFSTPIASQPSSPLLSLPSEVRLEIYHHVFSLPPSPGEYTYTVRSLLLTSRLIHDEALVPALRALKIRITGRPKLSFDRGISTLGDFTQNLRHVSISMSIAKLDFAGPNNPFVLSMLPLCYLDVNFTDVRMVHRNCRKELRLYYKLISAFLFCTSPTGPDEPLRLLHREPLHRLSRSLGVASWGFSPTREHLFEVVTKMKTAEVNVSMPVAVEDILWQAFLYFDLVKEELTVLKYGDGERKVLVFYDEEQQWQGNTWGTATSRLKIARAVLD